MRTLKEIEADIYDLKEEHAQIVEFYGIDSIEYAEIMEKIETLQDEYIFVSLYGG